MARINLPEKPKKEAESVRVKRRHHFYNSKEWKQLRRQIIENRVFCEDCKLDGYLNNKNLECHHIQSPFAPGLTKDTALRLALDPDNILLLCKDCHIKRHRENNKEKEGTKGRDIQ